MFEVNHYHNPVAAAEAAPPPRRSSTSTSAPTITTTAPSSSTPHSNNNNNSSSNTMYGTASHHHHHHHQKTANGKTTTTTKFDTTPCDNTPTSLANCNGTANPIGSTASKVLRKLKFINVSISTSPSTPQSAIEEKIIFVVRELFPTQLSDARADKFRITSVSGGTTNKLFNVKYIDDANNNLNVLVRVYGINTENLIDRKKELKIIGQLSELGLGAHVYGHFVNGFVYDFIEGVPLTYKDLPLHATKIAARMGEWHTMAIDISEQENGKPVLFKNIYKWLALVHEAMACNPKAAQRVAAFDLTVVEQEVRALERLLAHCEVRFCHNDLAAQNIIYNKEKQSFYFIDTEYCDYNYRSFDLANHFCEWAGFGLRPSDYPPRPQQLQFLETYLETVNRLSHRNRNRNRNCSSNRHGSNGCDDDDDHHHETSTITTSFKPSREQVEQLCDEVNKFSLLSHLSWGLWALYQSAHSEIDFDFIAYAKGRFDWYWQEKENMLRDHYNGNDGMMQQIWRTNE